MPWSTVVASDTKSYRVFTQEKTQSCGVACTMMILKLKQNREVDEGTVRGYFTAAEGTANTDASGRRDFNAIGTTQSPIIGVLAQYKIGSNQVARLHVAKWLKNASASKPVILGVDWVGGGGHWVVCVGYGTNMICLDPYYGLVETPVAGFPFYTVNATTQGNINDLIQLA